MTDEPTLLRPCFECILEIIAFLFGHVYNECDEKENKPWVSSTYIYSLIEKTCYVKKVIKNDVKNIENESNLNYIIDHFVRLIRLVKYVLR